MKKKNKCQNITDRQEESAKCFIHTALSTVQKKKKLFLNNLCLLLSSLFSAYS